MGVGLTTSVQVPPHLWVPLHRFHALVQRVEVGINVCLHQEHLDAVELTDIVVGVVVVPQTVVNRGEIFVDLEDQLAVVEVCEPAIFKATFELFVPMGGYHEVFREAWDTLWCLHSAGRRLFRGVSHFYVLVIDGGKERGSCSAKFYVLI